jgi:uncharacterized membrane protein (UPF0136 family)
MQDKFSFWITLIFALCLIGFGYVGYHKTGSLASLYTSFTFGVLLLASSLGILLQKKWGQKGAILWSALLTVVFFYRTMTTHKPVPTVLFIVSLVVFCVLLYRRVRRQH